MSRYHIINRRHWEARRRIALDRADWRCQAVENGERCTGRASLEVDHIVPLAAGGSHNPENLQVLCRRHHRAKTNTEAGRPSGFSEWRELVADAI